MGYFDGGNVIYLGFSYEETSRISSQASSIASKNRQSTAALSSLHDRSGPEFPGKMAYSQTMSVSRSIGWDATTSPHVNSEAQIVL